MAPSSSRVVQMRYPDVVLDAVDEAAAAAGVTRTQWVLDAVRARLGIGTVPDAGTTAGRPPRGSGSDEVTPRFKSKHVNR